MYKNIVKRSLDFFFALILLILSSPFLLIACIAIPLESRGSPVFSHQRVGYKNKIFTVYKLRTMCLETHRDGRKLRDRERVTKVGRILRKTSIDELPQLINILKGEMSFIGPRPLPVRYYPFYTEEEILRHEVRPGITGLAQINGRSNLEWEKRFEYDVYYYRNLSLGMDLDILWKTIGKVFGQKDTSTIRPASLVDFDIHRKGQERRSAL